MNPVRSEMKITTDRVRAASEEGVVRYILGFSMALTVSALSLIWISAAAFAI